MEDLCIMALRRQDEVRYAPMYIRRFPIGKKILPDQRYEEILNIPDRLRWCRLSRGLLQAEVAERVGMSCSAYKNMEAGKMQHLPRDAAQGLAQFYNIPVSDLLDAYDQFLDDGQAVRIRNYRESLGLGKKPFARKLGIPIRNLRAWENGTKILSRQSWERYFKGIA